MILAIIASWALLAPGGEKPPKPVAVAEVAAAGDLHPGRYQPFPVYDAHDERELLKLTNRDRERNGLAPLQLEEGLSSAARAHAAEMAKSSELSHQLSGESPLQQRIAVTTLHLDQAGENVALSTTIDRAHDGLMHSPHHRDNILNQQFNVVGLGVVRVNDRIYVVEDFGHSLPTVPAQQAEDLVAATILRSRSSAVELKRLSVAGLHSQACSMAASDKLDAHAARALGNVRYVLTYTNMQPDVLPSNVAQVLGDKSVRSFAVGACYANTHTYPTGAYFVTLAFY
jgi:uncharacterized protein YkwD